MDLPTGRAAASARPAGSYEEVLRTLRLENRTDPATEMIAKKIIELAQCGERDPIRLCEHAIRSLSE